MIFCGLHPTHGHLCQNKTFHYPLLGGENQAEAIRMQLLEANIPVCPIRALGSWVHLLKEDVGAAILFSPWCVCEDAIGQTMSTI